MTLPLSSGQSGELQQNKNSHAFAKWPRRPDQVNEIAPWLQPGTHHQCQSLSRLFRRSKASTPQDPDPAAPAHTPVSNLFLSEVADLVPTPLCKMPRLIEPGSLGTRAEHLYDFGIHAGDSNLFVQIVAHIAAAEVFHSVLQYLRSGPVMPLAKPTGGHRPLLMMSFLRRLALKSVMTAKKESVAKCAGPPE